MRNLHSNISNIGIQSISHVITLIVRSEVVRSLRASLTVLRWYASRLSSDMRAACWHGAAMVCCMAKQPAPCFATAKQPGRTVRVTAFRSVD